MKPARPPALPPCDLCNVGARSTVHAGVCYGCRDPTSKWPRSARRLRAGQSCGLDPAAPARNATAPPAAVCSTGYGSTPHIIEVTWRLGLHLCRSVSAVFRGSGPLLLQYLLASSGSRRSALSVCPNVPLPARREQVGSDAVTVSLTPGPYHLRATAGCRDRHLPVSL